MPNVLAANFSRVRWTNAVCERCWSGMNALVFGRMFITASGVCLGLITPLQICYQETGSEASSFRGRMLSTVGPLSGHFVTLPNSNKTFFFFMLIITITPGSSGLRCKNEFCAWKFHKFDLICSWLFLSFHAHSLILGEKKANSIQLQESASEHLNYCYQVQRGRLCSKIDSSDRKRESFCRRGQVKKAKPFQHQLK